MDESRASLEKWRTYFCSANSGIFEIIENAIMVALCDYPYDFKLKRDRIAEMLFSCKCFGCNRIDSCLEKSAVEENSSKDEEDYVEALNDEIEEESKILEEIFRIKETVDNSEQESDELFDSLRKLQSIPLSVEILKETEIGKSVNALRKHGSTEIRKLVRILIEDWRLIVDAWCDATTAIAGGEGTIESEKTSVVEEEEGLPSPPLDEGAFLATPASMELSQFFDDMNDDGNPLNKSGENGRTREPESVNLPVQKSRSPNYSRAPQKSRDERKQESTFKKVARPCKPNGPGQPKPAKLSSEPNVNNASKTQQNDVIQKKPIPHQREKLNCDNDETSLKAKLEVAKRKLHERYQEVDKAKKQRTIQVVEMRDLPKPSLAQMNRQMRPFNHNRQREQRRR